MFLFFRYLFFPQRQTVSWIFYMFKIILCLQVKKRKHDSRKPPAWISSIIRFVGLLMAKRYRLISILTVQSINVLALVEFCKEQSLYCNFVSYEELYYLIVVITVFCIFYKSRFYYQVKLSYNHNHYLTKTLWKNLLNVVSWFLL